ncbi:MAG: VPA1262 family N-terminal domain-containing protein [Pseudomonadota bacterium]
MVKNHKNITCGICRYYRSIDEIKEYFNDFINSKEWKLSGNKLKTSQFNFLPKQYVPADGTQAVALNSILKNNFHSGSYILECFDENKIDINFLLQDTVALKDLSESIYNVIPISIAKLSDRLGNIILQFPINIVSVDSKPLRQEPEGMQFEFIWHPKIANNPPQCRIINSTEFDSIFLGFGHSKVEKDICKVVSGNTDTSVKSFLYDEVNQLFLAHFKGSYIKTTFLNSHIKHPEPRIFKNGVSKPHRIEIHSSHESHIGKQPYKNYVRWTQDRLYEEERKKMEKDRSFVQYANGNFSQRKKALDDVRFLIKKYGENVIYLWDPYLTANDIINTLYFCTSYNAPLKAISSINALKPSLKLTQWEEKLKDTNESIIKLNKWKNIQNFFFKTTNNNNNYGINLEFRVQHNNYGWKFHDRFLIFPNFNDKVKVWSLGTSVNSLGNKHHILQEIKNARHILDAFNELWNKLQHESCLVWKYPNE